MKKNHEGPLPALIAAAIAVSVIATMQGLWWIWIPLVFAIAVVSKMFDRPGR